MILQPPSLEQLSNVISQITGPAFLLVAEAQLLTVLVSRMDRIIDRSRALAATAEDDPQAHLKAELPILRRRAKLMHRAIYWGVASCVITSLMVILGFVTAFLHIQHEYGAATMFAFAMATFTVALIAFWREVALAVSEFQVGVSPPGASRATALSHRNAGRGLG